MRDVCHDLTLAECNCRLPKARSGRRDLVRLCWQTHTAASKRKLSRVNGPVRTNCPKRLCASAKHVRKSPPTRVNLRVDNDHSAPHSKRRYPVRRPMGRCRLGVSRGRQAQGSPLISSSRCVGSSTRRASGAAIPGNRNYLSKCHDADDALVRPPQKEIIEATLEGRDVYVQAATSFGKSLCFQLPAVINPGSASSI